MDRRPHVAGGLLALLLSAAFLGACAAPEGGASEIPDWVLLYPDVEPVVVTTTEEDGGKHSGTLSFTSGDPAKDVLLFYRDGMQKEGWEVTTTPFLRPDDVRGGQITAEAPNEKRGVHVMVNALDGGSETILNYSEVP